MYYPKSQIKTNLYTNGNEYVIESTNSPYVGPYYLTSTEEAFTGKTPNDLPTQKLIKITQFLDKIPLNLLNELVIFSFTENFSIENNTFPINSESVFNYATLQNINTYSPPVKFKPYYLPTLPTTQDYQNGEFQRYFCKKINEIIYIEIDEKQFTLLVNKDSQIEFSLYEPFTVAWQLVGNKQEVARVNKNIVELLMFRNKLPKFNIYLKEDYTKYFQ